MRVFVSNGTGSIKILHGHPTTTISPAPIFFPNCSKPSMNPMSPAVTKVRIPLS